MVEIVLFFCKNSLFVISEYATNIIPININPNTNDDEVTNALSLDNVITQIL